MEKEFRNKIYSKLSKLYEEELSLRNKIYTKLYKLYEEYSDFQVNCGTFSTVVDKKKVISQNKKGQYVKNLKGTLGKVDKIEFVEENSKINYIKRILYKDNESEEGSIRKSYKIENFSEESILYIATTTVGDQNDITFHDILNAINKKEKGKDEEERRKKFENSFILEKIQTLGKRKEINVTLNTNNNQKMYFYHFIIVEGDRIMISNLFTFICQKQLIKRGFLNKMYLKYIHGIKNNIYYYYKILYNSVTKDFNNKFVFNISFYSNNEENNALEEKRFEEAEVQNISMKNSLCLSSMASSSNSQNNINEEKRFEEAEAENIYKDIELKEVKYMNKDNNSLMEEDSDSSQNLNAYLSQRITEEKHMTPELPEVQNVSMKDGLCLSSITSSNYSHYNHNTISSTGYSQNNDNTISSTSYSRNNNNTMSSSNYFQNNNNAMSSSSYSQNNINEEKKFEEAEAENIYKDIEFEEVKYMNKDNNSLMEEDSHSSPNLNAYLSQRITEEKHMTPELPEVQNISMKDGLCLSSITSSSYSQNNNNTMSSTSYSQNNDNTMSSSSNSQNSNNIEVNEQIGNIINGTQFVGDVFCELNEGIIKIGGIYLENNEYNIKANNNKVIGKIVTFNGTECVITTKIVVCNGCNVIQNNIIGTIVVSREGKSLLSVENNKIGKFYQFGDKRILYLNDMDNLLTQYLIVNTDVLEILNNITNDRITYLRDMNNLITHCLIAQNLMANVHVPVFLNNITNDRITYLKDINNLITHYLIENANRLLYFDNNNNYPWM
jgi:hypothetical protein